MAIAQHQRGESDAEPRLITVAPKKLRILFCVTGYFPAVVGGTERQARLQAEELTRRGHYIDVVCPRHTSTSESKVGDAPVIRLRGVSRRPFRTVSYLVRLLFFLLRNARRYDLVHIHLANLQADTGVLAVRVARRPTLVKVACGGSQSEMRRLRRVAWATRWYGLRHATRVQALSREIEEELQQIGVPRERMVRIPNGVDLREFSPPSPKERGELRRRLSLPLDTPIALFLGRFARYKGIDDLLSAWSVVSENGRLVLAGTGVDTHGGIGKVLPGERIEVRSWTNRPAEYLKACDIFVYPSHADGMSNALLEAMACGMAPIATAHGATEEMLTHGNNALLVAPHDPRSLVEALNELLRDSNQRSTISTQALETARRYSIAKVTDQIESVYYQVLSSSDSTSSVPSVGRADGRRGK